MPAPNTPLRLGDVIVALTGVAGFFAMGWTAFVAARDPQRNKATKVLAWFAERRLLNFGLPSSWSLRLASTLYFLIGTIFLVALLKKAYGG